HRAHHSRAMTVSRFSSSRRFNQRLAHRLDPKWTFTNAVARHSLGAESSCTAQVWEEGERMNGTEARGPSQSSIHLTSDMKPVINEERLAFVASVCPDGTPNLSPKGTIAAFDDEHLVFVDIRSPGTIRNLEQNPSTEINVVDQFCRNGYRFKGSAQIV